MRFITAWVAAASVALAASAACLALVARPAAAEPVAPYEYAELGVVEENPGKDRVVRWWWEEGVSPRMRSDTAGEMAAKLGIVFKGEPATPVAIVNALGVKGWELQQFAMAATHAPADEQRWLLRRRR